MRMLCRCLLLVMLLPAGLQARDYTPAPENLQNREWFQDAKFGLFIHWGVYSVMGVEEWVMETQQIDKATYARLADFFNPVEFDAGQWVLMAKDAGMKYITVTAKHHDGFALFDSQHSDWDIVDRTLYGKDVLAQLAEACRAHGLRLFFYYSQLDWHHDDYFPRGRTGHHAGRPDQGDWDAYIDFMNAQLTELLTNYGDVAGIWFDGWWDRPDAGWRLRETYDLIHRLQPAALIGSNHHQAPMPGEDFQMFEKDLPGHNTAGYNSNFLLNVGPMPNGRIQPEFVQTLGLVGDWTERHGDSIYGTRGGPIPPQAWGVTTQKGDRVFLHVLDWQQDSLLIPALDRPIAKVAAFPGGAALDWATTEFGTLLRLPENTGEPDRIVEVTLGVK